MQNRSSSQRRERVDGYPRGRRNRSQNYNLADSYPIDVVDGDGIEDEIGENPTRNTFDNFVDEYEYESSSSGDFELYERGGDSSSENLDLTYNQSESTEDDDSSNESDLESTSTGNQSESSDDDDDIARCAICFRKDDQSDNWRRLMTLPCCGNDGREETSSTRFCAACMLHLATDVRPGQIADDEYQHWDKDELDSRVRIFYENDCQTLSTRYIHCPRCKDICFVHILNPTRGVNSNWTRPTNADFISLLRPRFNGRCLFVGKKVGIASILWKMAFFHHRLIPLEGLLGGSTKKEDVLRLVKWGILKMAKNNPDMFMMKKGDHNELKYMILGHQLRWCPFFDDILMDERDEMRFPLYGILMGLRDASK